MKFRVYFTHSNGMSDELVIEEETIEEIREVITNEMSRRGATYDWSEKISD